MHIHTQTHTHIHTNTHACAHTQHTQWEQTKPLTVNRKHSERRAVGLSGQGTHKYLLQSYYRVILLKCDVGAGPPPTFWHTYVRRLFKWMIHNPVNTHLYTAQSPVVHWSDTLRLCKGVTEGKGQTKTTMTLPLCGPRFLLSRWVGSDSQIIDIL